MSRQNQRTQKSRPERLAQHHLAFLAYIEDCRKNGREVDFSSDESMRFILRDQSGSYIHHTPQKHNDCDTDDPLKHILKDSTICGAGTDLSVFRNDTMHFSVRLWIELYLTPIMDEIDNMEREWNLLTPYSNTEGAQSEGRLQSHLRELKRQERDRVFEDLVSPTGGGNRIAATYGPPRPLF